MNDKENNMNGKENNMNDEENMIKNIICEKILKLIFRSEKVFVRRKNTLRIYIQLI